MSLRISAVICTHNRKEFLPGAIESLARQNLPASEYEILVIDNASQDGTADLLRRWPGGLRWESEPLPGLSRARNRAIQLAAGEIIAFLDDDAVASPGWLTGLLAGYSAFPEAWAAGGKVELNWQSTRPAWLADDFLKHLSRLDLGAEARLLAANEFIWGTNCSFRREALEQVGFFRPSLGRRGKQLVLQKRIRQAGGQVAYLPEALVHHRVSGERLKPGYFIARAYGAGYSAALLSFEERGQPPFRQAGQTSRNALRDASGWHSQASRLRSVRRLAYAAGYWHACLSARFQNKDGETP